jgi:hypothetical protein
MAQVMRIATNRCKLEYNINCLAVPDASIAGSGSGFLMHQLLGVGVPVSLLSPRNEIC